MGMTGQEAWQEFARTIGMLCEAETGDLAPSDPDGLLEYSTSHGIIPSDFVPLLRSAIAAVKRQAWSPTLRDDLLRIMYRISGPVGTRIVCVGLKSIGYSVQDADDWKAGTPGFFARRGDQTLYVVPIFTREDPPQPIGEDEEFLIRYLDNTVKNLERSSEFAQALPTLVVIRASNMITTFDDLFKEKPQVPLRPYLEFLLPFDDLPLVAGRLLIWFSPEL